jgi:CRISPR-associated protein Csm5
MNPLATYRLLITPLSPVHIGTGESYEPTNYVIDAGVLHEFDTGAAMAALSDADRKTLLEIGNRRPDAGMIEALQRFFHERRAALMAHAIQRIPVLPGVADLYAKRVGQTANREADGKKVINKLEIDRTGFNPVTRLPVLFGSSIKGAIRTALLDHVNGGTGLLKVVDRHTGKRRDENNQELQNRLFQYRAGKFELDPMRLVHLADAEWTGEAGLPAAQVRLAVNRKKSPVRDKQGNLRKSQAESKDLYQILECIPSWHYRAFSGPLTVQSLAGLDHRHNDKLPAANLRFDLARITQACNAFYRPILDEERRQLRGRGYLDAQWDKTLETLLKGQAGKFQSGKLFLLRVGRHSGAESVTLNGVRYIKIKKGDGEKPEYLDSSKTWWLAAEDKDQMQNLVPFGWLLVEVHPLQDLIADWHPLKEACAPYLAKAREIKDKLDAQQARLAETLAQAEATRREAEEKARHEAERAAQREREEAERQARLQNMTENMRRIETFKSDMQARAEQLRAGKDRPNTKYHDHARALARAAREDGTWTPEEKRAAAEAIEEWLPKVIAVEMKEERKKLKLRELMCEA